MRYLADVAAEAIGDDHYTSVTAALAGGDTVRERVWERMAAAYADLPTRTTERKPGEFIPGWPETRASIGDPIGSAPAFVVRALLYSHRVAVADPLKLQVRGLTGEPGPHHGFDRALRVVLLLGPFEREGLVVYLNPDVPERAAGWRALDTYDGIPVLPLPTDPSDDELDYFYDEYLAGRRVSVDHTLARSDQLTDVARRGAAADAIAWAWWEYRDLLAWQTHHANITDLYVPDHLRPVAEWVLRRKGATLVTGESNDRVLSSLCRLPLLNGEALGRLTARDLILLREERTFARWRQTLQAAATYAEASGSDAQAVADFVLSVTAAHERVRRETSARQTFKPLRGEISTFGISVAADTTQSVVSGVATGVAVGSTLSSGLLGALAGAGVTVAQPLVRTAARAARQPARRDALDRVFSLFASDS